MSLKKFAASGVKWTTVSSITTTALQFIQLAVLARLLSPEDFGLMAMVAVVIGFAAAYADMGISAAIIHRQDATREQLSSLYWLNLLAGLLVYLVVLAMTPAIVALYGEPRISGLMPWITLTFLINPLGTQFQLLLQKSLCFRRLALIEISAALVGASVAVVTARFGQGVFALIWGTLSSNMTSTLLLLSVGLREWRPQWHFRYADLTGYLSLAVIRWVSAASIILTAPLTNYSLAPYSERKPWATINWRGVWQCSRLDELIRF